jgi:hypothetical protein
MKYLRNCKKYNRIYYYIQEEDEWPCRRYAWAVTSGITINVQKKQ